MTDRTAPPYRRHPTLRPARRGAPRRWAAAAVVSLLVPGAWADVPRTEPVSSCCNKAELAEARKNDAAGAAATSGAGGAKKGYVRGEAAYAIPGLVLVDQDGRKVPLNELFARDRAVAVNFIFTTCRTICPVLSTTMANLRRGLAGTEDDLTLVSISIDPEYDTPAILKSYAGRFSAGSDWRFLTGTSEDIAAVQKAFEAYAGDKMAHRPLTFLKPAGSDRWVRVDGFPKTAEIVEEWRRVSEKG